jgi:hypothetical protein
MLLTRNAQLEEERKQLKQQLESAQQHHKYLTDDAQKKDVLLLRLASAKDAAQEAYREAKRR